MNRPRLLGATLVCCVLVAGSARRASAEPITFQIDGVLSVVPAELAGDFAVGDAFSYALGLDMASLFNNSYTPWLDFAGSIGGWEFQGVGGGTFYSTATSIIGELHHFQPTLIAADPVGASDEYRALGAFRYMDVRSGCPDPWRVGWDTAAATADDGVAATPVCISA